MTSGAELGAQLIALGVGDDAALVELVEVLARLLAVRLRLQPLRLPAAELPAVEPAVNPVGTAREGGHPHRRAEQHRARTIHPRRIRPDANVCSHAMPPPYRVVRTRLERALANRDLAAVRAAARDLPRVVTLADAVHILVLMLDADDAAF